ncbi:MAG: triose-phosphate isomerase [bacterium]|nr:triose-phosphate isomerase [bacterium]
MTARRPLLAGNWKMNPESAGAATDLVEGISAAATAEVAALDVAVLPPFPWLVPVAGLLDGMSIDLGAQDCYWEPSGAFTGEVSARMLNGWCRWVLTGHSERRWIFGETDEMVVRKTRAALECRLGVIACVGEREDEHERGETDDVVRRQVRAILDAVREPHDAEVAFAYEPVWAIGTGRSADPAHAARVMGLMRSLVAEGLGEGAAREVRLLYGGSVKAENVGGYVELEDCDGCLVGGASLQAGEFSRMIEVVGGMHRR